MEQEKWIETILNSTNGITKVTPKEMLFSKIQEKINSKNIVPIRIAWAAAASIAILLSLNFIIISESKNASPKTELVASYISKTNQLY